jgi:hypothetical protein
MNLRSIANSVTTAINPNITGTWQQSTGYTVGTDFKQVPAYDTYENLPIQVQELTQSDIRMMDGLNIQGVLKVVYINELPLGVVRTLGQGGDILQFPLAGETTVRNWLVVRVKEQYPDWASVIVCIQT